MFSVRSVVWLVQVILYCCLEGTWWSSIKFLTSQMSYLPWCFFLKII